MEALIFSALVLVVTVLIGLAIVRGAHDHR